jgi:hypothetical protein
MKYITPLILLFVITILSCSKDKPSVPSTINTQLSIPVPIPDYVMPPAVPDSLIGKEYLFEDLTWVNGFDDFMDRDEVFVITPARLDIFNFSSLKLKVYLKFNDTSDWIEARNHYYYSPYDKYYWYYNNGTNVKVLVNNLDMALLNKRATIRVKVL